MSHPLNVGRDYIPLSEREPARQKRIGTKLSEKEQERQLKMIRKRSYHKSTNESTLQARLLAAHNLGLPDKAFRLLSNGRVYKTQAMGILGRGDYEAGYHKLWEIYKLLKECLIKELSIIWGAKLHNELDLFRGKSRGTMLKTLRQLKEEKHASTIEISFHSLRSKHSIMKDLRAYKELKCMV